MTIPVLSAPLLLAAGPAFAFLAPVEDVWQVWASRHGERPAPITRDHDDKIALSSAPRAGTLLTLTRRGKGLLLRPSGAPVGVVDLAAGADDAALSPDGRLIAFVREERTGAVRERRVWVIGRDGTGAHPLGAPPALQHAPAWSPDGVSLAFTAASPDGAAEDVFLVRLDGVEDRQLTAGPHRYLEPSVAPDGSVFVSSDRGGDYDIWRLDAADGAARPIITSPGFDGEPQVSPDGGRVLFVSRRSGRAEVWMAGADGSAARALTSEPAEIRRPVWLAAEGAGDPPPARKPVGAAGAPGSTADAASPAAQGFIAFLRFTEGSWQPWAARPDGSDLRRLAALPVDVARLTLSRDGRGLLADGIDGSLFLVDTTDGKVKRLKVDPPGPTDAALSADGRRIVYSVNTLGGIDSNDLWLVGAQGGRARRLTDQPYLQHFPSWGPGGEIYYLSGRGGQTHDIWRVSADHGAPRQVLGEHRYNFEPAVSERGDLAFSSNEDGNYDIWILEAGAEAPKPLTRDPAYDGQPAFSPDGSRVAFLSRRGGAGRIWIHDRSSGRESPLPVEGEVRMPFWYAGTPGAVSSGGHAGERA